MADLGPDSSEWGARRSGGTIVAVRLDLLEFALDRFLAGGPRAVRARRTTRVVRPAS